MRDNPVKRALKAGRPAVGTWLSLCNPIAARFLTRMDFDWLTVDMEHSPYGWDLAGSLIATIADGGGTPIVRVPAGNHDHIKRALDSGAHGFVVPMVMDRKQAEACVAAAKYPPLGNRSVGGSLHALSFDATPKDYYTRANDEIVVILQCEHIDAVRKAEEIFSVPGIDAIFVGPNDLLASMRRPDGSEATAEEFEAALGEILAACKRNGVAAGLHCFSASDVARRAEEGWQFLALCSDLSFLLAEAKRQLEVLGRGKEGRLANY